MTEVEGKIHLSAREPGIAPGERGGVEITAPKWIYQRPEAGQAGLQQAERGKHLGRLRNRLKTTAGLKPRNCKKLTRGYEGIIHGEVIRPVEGEHPQN